MSDHPNITGQARELVTALSAYLEKTKQGTASRRDRSEYIRNAKQLNTLLELRRLPGVNMTPDTALELTALEDTAIQVVRSVEANPRVLFQQAFLGIPLPIVLCGALLCTFCLIAYNYFVR